MDGTEISVTDAGISPDCILMFNTHPTAYCQHKQGYNQYTSCIISTFSGQHRSATGVHHVHHKQKWWQAAQQIQQPAHPACKHKLDQAEAVAILLL